MSKRRNIARCRVCLAQRRALRPQAVRPADLDGYVPWMRDAWWSDHIRLVVEGERYENAIEGSLLATFSNARWLQSAVSYSILSFPGEGDRSCDTTQHADAAWKPIARLVDPAGFVSTTEMTQYQSQEDQTQWASRRVLRYYLG